MYLRSFYVEELSHSSYLVGCEVAKACAVVDPERDPEPYLQAAAEKGMRITHVLETHLHADFVSGHRELAERTGARIAIPKKAGARYEHLPLAEGDTLEIGRVRLGVLETPGHTPESASYWVADTTRSPEPWLVFSGDTLFVGDVGRPDLFGSDRAAELAGALYDSLQEKLLRLPEGTEVYPAHGAGSLCGKGIAAKLSSTIGFEKKFNLAFAGRSRQEFIAAILAALPPAPPYFQKVSAVNREGPAILGAIRAPRLLSPEAFAEEAAKPGTVVLDAREAAAFGAGHVAGSINVPPGSRFPTWVGWTVPFGASVLLVLGREGEGLAAARSLARVGYDRIAGALQGGMPAWQQSGRDSAALPQITVHDLRRRIEAGEPPLVLDVRTDDEWKAGHIEGAVHAPLQRLEASLPPLEPGRAVAVVCGSGYRSNVAGSLLLRKGLRSVSSVIGGMTAWNNAGLPAPATGGGR